MSENKERTEESTEPRLFAIIAMVFVATMLISNIAAQKLFAFGPVVFTAGILVFPLAYIFGDVLTEIYGYNRARIVIWTSFGCNIFMSLVLWIAIVLPPAQGWPLQEQFAQVLGLVPRVVLASILGFWIGEFANSYIMAKMKIMTAGKWLPLRTITSTLVGQLLDTVTFVLVAFLFVFDGTLLFFTALYGWAFKVSYEVIVTPLTVLLVNRLKKIEGKDVYDRETDFNPFALWKRSGKR